MSNAEAITNSYLFARMFTQRCGNVYVQQTTKIVNIVFIW